MTAKVGVHSLIKIKIKVTVVLVVLMALQTPTLALGRFKMWKPFLEHVRARGILQEGIALELLHPHHIDSPYAMPNLTLTQRVVIAVKSSQERLQFFERQIYGQEAFSGHYTDLAYRTPVSFSQDSYVMQFNLGTPSRKLTALVDTGSDVIWVQCSKCVHCSSQNDPIFVPSASSSYKTRSCTDALCSVLYPPQPCSAQKTCQYEVNYGDQSSSQGDYASETVTFTSTTGSKHPFSGIGFGCGHNNQGAFSLADGLVGFGMGRVSLVSQLGSQINYAFAYCLVDFDSAPTKTSSLLLGATGGNALQYTPLARNNAHASFYYLTLNGILVGGTPLVYPSSAFAITSSGQGGLVLDSGTTLFQMDSRAYKPFVNRLASLITYPRVDFSKDGYDLCYDLSGVSSPTIPTVVFQFTNLNVELPPDNIFIQVDDVPNLCLAFLKATSGHSIYDSFQQQNFQIAYDLANRRVGFAPKTC